MRWLDSITDSVDMSRLNGHESEQTLGDSRGQGAWCAAVHRLTKSRTQFSDCTTTQIPLILWNTGCSWKTVII